MILRDRDTDANGSLDERLYALQDANFNVVALVDASGTVVERYEYDPFGAVTVLDGSYDSRGTSSYAWTVGFQGMAWDSVSGLWGSTRYRGTGYSPTLGRFITPDPLELRPDVNYYRFVENNPSNLTDPSGLWWDWWARQFDWSGETDRGRRLNQERFDRLGRSTNSDSEVNSIPTEGPPGGSSVGSLRGITHPRLDGRDGADQVMGLAGAVADGAADTCWNGAAQKAAAASVAVIGGRILRHHELADQIKRVKGIVDFASKNTVNRSAKYATEGAARDVVWKMVGRDAVCVGDNKWRSLDGKWQYRSKPIDAKHPTPHVHIERLNPNTGEVLENWRLFFETPRRK